MSPAPSPTPARNERPSIWVGPLVVWVVVLLLLAANVAIAFAPIGRGRGFANFALAGVQASLMGLVFMRLNRASPLVRLTAVAGLFWLLFLFVMSGADYFTRV